LSANETAVLLAPLDYRVKPAVSHGRYDISVSEYWRMHGRLCHSSEGQREGGGLGLADTLEVAVEGGYSIGAAGITPRLQHSDRTWWYAGRTIVFTGKFSSDAREYEEQVLRTTVHELCHAFGLAHGCGGFAAHGTGSDACAMHILNHWLVDARSLRAAYPQLIRWNPGTPRGRFCAQHLLGVRRTHLEENPVLWQW